MQTKKVVSSIGMLVLLLSLCSCTKLITSQVVEPAVGNIQQQTDITLVCKGAPSYLLMMDSMLVSNPESHEMLRMASKAYIGYSAALKECGESRDFQESNINKARAYALRLLEERLQLRSQPKTFQEKLKKSNKSDLPDLFWGAYGLLAWIQEQGGSPASMADLVIVEQLMERVLELDEGYEGGAAHLFWGAYYASKPAMLGGGPEKALPHFIRALELSKRSFLLTQVTYAKTYARLTFDQELHDSLLKEVLEFPLDAAPQYALSNRIAKKQARKLLDEEYFD